MTALESSAKKPVNLSLNEALVRESRAYCGNLSAKVEEMLQPDARHDQAEFARRAASTSSRRKRRWPTGTRCTMQAVLLRTRIPPCKTRSHAAI